MANTGKSSLTLVGRVCKMLTLSVFLGFGLSYCSGDSGSDEAVQVSEPSNDSAEAAPDSPVDGAPEAEAAAAPDNSDQTVAALDEGNPPPAVEESAPSAEVAETGPVVDEVAPPPAPEAMEASTETVNAELPENPAEHAKEAVAATSPQAPSADSTPPGFDAKPAQEVSAPVGDGNSVSSPGAAKYVASADGAKHKGHKHHKHHNDAAPAAADAGASAAPAEAIANPSEYIIEAGDSLALISKKIFGSVHHWQKLAAQNSINPPYKIFPGDALRFDASDPKAAEFVKGYKTTMKTLTVKSGDSLSKLAKEVYGNSGAWKRLLSFNRDKLQNPNHLEVGMTLAYMEDGAHAKPAAAAAAAAPAVKKADAPKANAKKAHKKKSAATTRDAE